MLDKTAQSSSMTGDVDAEEHCISRRMHSNFAAVCRARAMDLALQRASRRLRVTVDMRCVSDDKCLRN